MVEPAAGSREHEDPLRAPWRSRGRAPARGRSRPSQPGGARCERPRPRPPPRLRPTPSRSRRPRPSRRARVRARMSSPRSAATTGAPMRHVPRRARIRRIPSRHHHHDLFRHAFLRWHYPDQVLRVGGALVRPLSPAVPSSPLRSGHGSACRVRGRAGRGDDRPHLQPYADGPRTPLLRERRVRYLDERVDAPIPLVVWHPGTADRAHPSHGGASRFTCIVLGLMRE